MKITRRTAIRAIGAAMIAPCVTLRNEIDRERLLSAFVCPHDSWYDITKPFGVGSLTYATDARHICRAELVSRVEEGERRLPINLDQLYRSHWEGCGELVPFELPDWRKACIVPQDQSYSFTCPECCGRRVSMGDHYPPQEWLDGREASDYEYDIDDNTIRDKMCPACKGKDWHGPSILIVDGVRFEYARLKAVAALPNVRVARSGFGTGDEAIVFRAEGFEGVSMGIVLG